MLNRAKSRAQKHLLSRAGLVLQIGKELHVSKFRGALRVVIAFARQLGRTMQWKSLFAWFGRTELERPSQLFT